MKKLADYENQSNMGWCRFSCVPGPTRRRGRVQTAHIFPVCAAFRQRRRTASAGAWHCQNLGRIQQMEREKPHQAPGGGAARRRWLARNMPKKLRRFSKLAYRSGDPAHQAARSHQGISALVELFAKEVSGIRADPEHDPGRPAAQRRDHLRRRHRKAFTDRLWEVGGQRRTDETGQAALGVGV